MKLSNGLTYFFVTHAITQTNVHRNSRSIYAQSVSENNYDFNSRYVWTDIIRRQKMRKNVTSHKP
ncbi:ferredoxin [Lelliottia amnigena]|nr:ferredoxin [Lelliottia amnigena]PEG63816.1 ferredoxin [Lelliottia amnigena]